jgi:hypothetical protein
MGIHRSELQREVAEALVSSKAINFEAVGSIIAKFGARAAINGDAIGVIINHRVMDACIPVDPSLLFQSALNGGHFLKTAHE